MGTAGWSFAVHVDRMKSFHGKMPTTVWLSVAPAIAVMSDTSYGSSASVMPAIIAVPHVYHIKLIIHSCEITLCFQDFWHSTCFVVKYTITIIYHIKLKYLIVSNYDV